MYPIFYPFKIALTLYSKKNLVLFVKAKLWAMDGCF
jgi:hypothetical protein